MRRRQFITLLGSVAAAWPLAARAQQGERARRIGWFVARTQEDDPIQLTVRRTFDREMARLGWPDTRAVRVDIGAAAGDDRGLHAAAAELVAQVPDVIVVNGTQGATILQQQTSSIPIVFANVADPVASGFVAN